MPSDCNKSGSFPGLTVAFRNTPEYKDLAALIRTAYPAWSEYLVEMAICTHVQNPRAYREAKALCPQRGTNAEIKPVVCPDRDGAFDSSVNIYSDVAEIPEQLMQE